MTFKWQKQQQLRNERSPQYREAREKDGQVGFQLTGEMAHREVTDELG